MIESHIHGVDISSSDAEVAAEILKSLGHPLRLRIVSSLSRGPMHVKGLAERLDAVPAIISQQLRILRSANLVGSRTENGHAYYRITEPGLFNMLNCMASCLASRSQRGEP
jgi:ArsR family transcriptional regulator